MYPFNEVAITSQMRYGKIKIDFDFNSGQYRTRKQPIRIVSAVIIISPAVTLWK